MSDQNTSLSAEPSEKMLKHELSLEQRVLAVIDQQREHCLDCAVCPQLTAVRHRIEEVLFGTSTFRQSSPLTESGAESAGLRKENTVDEKAGSAETGGEKDASSNILNVAELLTSLLRDPHPGLATWNEAVERQARQITNHFGIFPDEAEWRKATFPRTSQNQTASSGVDGAHEGMTADKSDSRELEKLNNAQKVFNCSETEAFHRAFGVPCSKCEPALAESSLSSPPPQKGDSSAPTIPEILSTQPDTHTEKI